MEVPVDLSSVPDQDVFDEFERRAKCSKLPPRKLILFGPPGSGKGTQAKKLAHDLCSCHVSTGDLLREEIRHKTDLGKQAEGIMQSGGLVPDEIVSKIVQRKIQSSECKRGVVFDGFPRSLSQAKKLDEIVGQLNSRIDNVFNLEIDDKVLMDRLAGRRIHEKSGRSYHIQYNPPKTEGKDDVTGEPLTQRSDDRPESIQKRFNIYNKMMTPILDYYSTKGILHRIDAGQKIEKVGEEINKSLTSKA